MNEIIVYDIGGERLQSLYQWDINQTIAIKSADVSSAPIFHFTNKMCKQALVVAPTASGDSLTAEIPNILLQEADTIMLYLYSATGNGGYRTTHEAKIKVIPRPKPSDYAYVDNIDYESIAALQSRVETLQALLLGVTDSLEEAFWYDNGDTYSIYSGSGGAPVPINGFITSDQTAVILSLAVSKSLANISSVTVSKCKGALRYAGGYMYATGTTRCDNDTDWKAIESGGSSNTDGIAVTAEKKNDNMVIVKLTRQGGTFCELQYNNTPVSFGCVEFQLTFS